MKEGSLKKLALYLEGKEDEVISLSFEQIEDIIGEPLPEDARTKSSWWWNVKDSWKTDVWLKNGYATIQCKSIPINGTVQFKKIREAEPPLENIFKQIWYFLTEKDSEPHKKVIAFLEISVLPIIAIITFAILITDTNEASNINIDNRRIFVSGDYYEQVNINNQKQDSRIEIVDIQITEEIAQITFVNEKKGEEATYGIRIGTYIDIKLRNTGDTVAFLKRVVINVHEFYPLVDPAETNYSYVPVTETYDILLNGEQNQTFEVSQMVEANGTDRFLIKVMSDIGNMRMDVVYLFSVTLIYDEDDKTVESAKYIAVFPPNFNVEGCHFSKYIEENWEQNYSMIKYFASLEDPANGVFASQNFIELMEQYDTEMKLGFEFRSKFYSSTMLIFPRADVGEEDWEALESQVREFYNQLKDE